MKALALSLFTLMAGSAIATAQEAYVVEDGDVFEAPEPYDQPVGPRVYGWTSAPPSDCGTFKYWNGVYCADARFEPPVAADE